MRHLLEGEKRDYDILHSGRHNCYPIVSTPPPPYSSLMVTFNKRSGSFSGISKRFRHNGSFKHRFLPFSFQLPHHHSNTAQLYHQLTYQHMHQLFAQKNNNNGNSSKPEQNDRIDKNNGNFTVAIPNEHDYIYEKSKENEFDIDDGFEDDKIADNLKRAKTLSFLYNDRNIYKSFQTIF